MPKITQLFAFVMADTDDDDEGVPAFPGPGGMWMPMMGADNQRMQSLERMAQEMANAKGKTVTLVHSTGLEVVKTIQPDTA